MEEDISTYPVKCWKQALQTDPPPPVLHNGFEKHLFSVKYIVWLEPIIQYILYI